MERKNTLLTSIKNKFRKDASKAGAAHSETDKRAHEPKNPAGTRRPDGVGVDAFARPWTEAPPAYTRTSTYPVPAPAPAPAPSHLHTTTTYSPTAATTTAPPADDRYAFLSSFDTIFLIDDSGSMAGRSWTETRRALEAITPICTAHDADGIDIVFLNHADSPRHHNIQHAATVSDIFGAVRPRGATPTGQRLNQILVPYLQRLERDGADATKPLNIIVVTDGEPSDDVESVIIAAARKLDRFEAPAWQVGIQFFQVGREPGAREHLRLLDDELAMLAGDAGLRDMVDTVPFTGKGEAELTGDGILKVCLGAVNRRLDRKRSTDLHRR